MPFEQRWSRCDDTQDLCQTEGVPALCPPINEEDAECSARNLELNLSRFSLEQPDPVELGSCFSVYDEGIPF